MDQNITELKPNEIFVFGSNYAGRHGKGAALTALHKFGAISGRGCGIMGQSYGIATKDSNLKVLPLTSIQPQIRRFLEYAEGHPELNFIVTPIGCGLAGYKPKDIAPLFYFFKMPLNVMLPEVFLKYKR
jgi:hypothetical protein